MPKSYVIDTSRSRAAKLVPLPVGDVRFAPEGFWHGHFQGNRQISIPRLFDLFEEKGILDNFRRLTGKKDCPRRGPLYTDSDIYKWMEAAAFALASADDVTIRAQLETAITDILPAQCADGYLNTYFTDPATRFTVTDGHEMYCAGHYFQAAVAIYRCLGDDRVLKSATRFADYLFDRFGPGKKESWACGHPEIELALVELVRTTGDKKYLDFARHILDQLNTDGTRQTHWSIANPIKFTDRTELYGHAVRNGYLACAGSDLWAETGDPALGQTVRKLWDNLINHKIYITGGLGSRYNTEAIGLDYELPNLLAYAETCAAISNAMWAYRNLQITGEVQFADWLERGLYNGILSGISLDYQRYFYVNPLASLGNQERQEWFETTCCPTNLQRLLSSLTGYFYSTDSNGLWVHLYDAGTAKVTLKNGASFSLTQQTRYPFDGQIAIQIHCDKPESFALNLRIPGWAQNASLKINGQHLQTTTAPGTYCSINRQWRDADRMELILPLPVQFIACNPHVSDNHRRMALMRGPLVYCLENVDNRSLSSVHLAGVENDFRTLSSRARLIPATGFGRSITAIELPGYEIQTAPALYQVVDQYQIPTRPANLTAIPYFAWANRGKSQMTTWLPVV